jgi:hypothetical protein
MQVFGLVQFGHASRSTNSANPGAKGKDNRSNPLDVQKYFGLELHHSRVVVVVTECNLP